jgi:hypothetical protein
MWLKNLNPFLFLFNSIFLLDLISVNHTNSFYSFINSNINMSKFVQLLNSRNYSSALFRAGIILLFLLFIDFVPSLFGNTTISIWVAVQEMGLPEQGGYFTFQIKNILRMVLLGPVHSLICYAMIHPLIGKSNSSTPKDSPNQDGRNRNKGQFLDHILVLFLMINTTGHIVHWLFDRSNFLYRAEVGDYNTNPVFLLIYASDEFLGHALIHISYFVFFLLLAIIDLINKKEHVPKWEEWIITLFISGGVFVLNGYAAKIGESAFVLLLLSIVAIIFFGVICIRRKRTIIQSPMALAFLLGSIITLGYILSVVFIDGVLPSYPFIT